MKTSSASGSKHDTRSEQLDAMLIMELLQKMIHKSIKTPVPNFTQFSHKIKRALQSIFTVANLEKASFPHARVSAKVFGNILLF